MHTNLLGFLPCTFILPVSRMWTFMRPTGYKTSAWSVFVPLFVQVTGYRAWTLPPPYGKTDLRFPLSGRYCWDSTTQEAYFHSRNSVFWQSIWGWAVWIKPIFAQNFFPTIWNFLCISAEQIISYLFMYFGLWHFVVSSDQFPSVIVY